MSNTGQPAASFRTRHTRTQHPGVTVSTRVQLPISGSGEFLKM